MVAITGDTHGDFERISHFCHELETTMEDIMVILGEYIPLALLDKAKGIADI